MNQTLVCSAFLLTLIGFVATPDVEARLVLIDFGLANNQTSQAPAGTFWNNVVGTDDSIGGSGAVDTDAVATGITLSITDNFTGPNNPGGLTSPNPALLGDFGVASVTADYLFFVDSLTPQITLGGLDANSVYELSFFGTRATSGTRTTTYAVTGGAGPLPALTLTTSGTDIGSDGLYDGNDDMIAVLSSVTPNGSNEIVIDFSGTGGFGYLGAMSIQISAIPEPSLLLAFAGGAVGMVIRHRPRCPDRNHG